MPVAHVFDAWNKRDLYSDKKQDEMELALLSGSALYMSQVSGLGGLSGLERMKPAGTAGLSAGQSSRGCVKATTAHSERCCSSEGTQRTLPVPQQSSTPS